MLRRKTCRPSGARVCVCGYSLNMSRLWPSGVGNHKMKVRVQFYAQLRDLIGIRELEIDLSEGATVHDLLDQIYAKQPALRSHDKSILIGAGVEFVDRSHKLKPGEEIAIMPPVQGG